MNQIDHILVDKRYTSHILDIRSKRGANVDSDHFLVVAKIRVKIIHRIKKRGEPDAKIWNSEKLRNEEIVGKLRRRWRTNWHLSTEDRKRMWNAYGRA